MKSYLFVCTSMLIWMVGCQLVKNNYPDDNPVEESIEDVIENKTGINVDFTGRTPEK